MTNTNDNWTFDPSKYEGDDRRLRYHESQLCKDGPALLAERIRRGEEIERLRKEAQKLRQEAEANKPKPIDYESHDGWRARVTDDYNIQFADTTMSDAQKDGRDDE